MNNLTILDVGSNFGMSTGNIFSPWQSRIISKATIKTIQENINCIDLVVFGGGGDISPKMYNHKMMGSYSTPELSYRDLFEREVWKISVARNKPILGICRGAQLACILSGGSLIQDVWGHNGSEHMMNTIDGTTVPMTSAHHQMMFPFSIKHEMIAWVPVELDIDKRYSYDPKIKLPVPFDKEPEVVFFPETRSLGIQGHPEFYSNPMTEAVVYTRHLVQKYLFAS